MGPPRDGRSGSGRPSNSYAQSGTRTPVWGNPAGRTPNPYASGDGRTPAWNASSRTPNPYAVDGARTPAWNASSRTPNPYAADGGRTPAWNANSRTPNPYTAGSASGNSSTGGWGGATPRVGGASGGATPKANNAWANADNGWTGSASPAHQSWGDQSGWGGDYQAPTPGAAATPRFAAPTPAATAATPGASGDSYSYNNPDTPKDVFINHAYSGMASVFTPGVVSAPTPAVSSSHDDHMSESEGWSCLIVLS